MGNAPQAVALGEASLKPMNTRHEVPVTGMGISSTAAAHSRLLLRLAAGAPRHRRPRKHPVLWFDGISLCAAARWEQQALVPCGVLD